MFVNIIKAVGLTATAVMVPVVFGAVGLFDREIKHEEYLEEVKTRAPLNRNGNPYVAQPQQFTVTSMVSYCSFRHLILR